MERLSAGSQVLSLSAALAPVPPTVTSKPALPAEPDPRELLAQERLRVLEAARAEGLAKGMEQAEDAIGEAVERARAEVERAHAEEGERLASATQRMTQMLRSLQTAVAENDDRIESLAAEIAYSAVMRVLGTAAADRSLIARLCEQALNDYRQRPVTLRVAPGESACLDALVHGEDVRVIADPQLTAGQCRLETHKGIYDTSVEARLDAVKQAFLNALAAGGPLP